MSQMKQLRPYQTACIDQLREGVLSGFATQMCMSPTGSGKTTIAGFVLHSAYQKGKRAFFIVDSLELVDQAAETFLDMGMQVGVIQGQHYLTNLTAPIQVATIQSLKNRWDVMPAKYRPDLLFIDEAHVLHQAHEEMVMWAREHSVPVIGLSATPFRDGLGKIFDRMVVSTTTKALIDQGHLAPYQAMAPYIPNLQGVRQHKSDYVEAELEKVMGDAKVVGDVVDTWLKHASNRRTLVFACSVKHSRFLADAFQKVGIKAAHIDGYEKDLAKRQQIINQFRTGEIQVLCNVAVLTKGFDAPECDCVVLARPTKSLALHIQMIGRGLRTAPNKQDCLILDHSGNLIRVGLPDDDLPMDLNMGEIKRSEGERERRLRDACPECQTVTQELVCPNCGHERDLKEMREGLGKREDVEVRDGELWVITKKGQEKAKELTPEQVGSLYAQLLYLARSQGKKDGWAYYTCRDLAGRAPRATRGVQPIQPSNDTRRMVKARVIRMAKRREAEQKRAS